jgi:hypothetical protein
MRWFPKFQVATAGFSNRPPQLKLSKLNFLIKNKT